MKLKIKYAFIFLMTIAALGSCRKTVQLNIEAVVVDTLSRQNFQDMVFISDDTAFIVGGIRYGNGQLIYTYDGGATWHLKDSLSQWIITSIIATKDKQLYAAGVTGKIFHSVDRGQTWDIFQTGDWNDLENIISVGDSVFYAVGGASNTAGITQRLASYYGGWWQTNKVSRMANNLDMVTKKIGYLICYGAIYKTINGGKTWDITSAKGDNFMASHFFNEDHGLVIGYEGTLLETTDGGKTWKRKRNGNNPFNANWQFTDLKFVDETTGYIAGTNGLLLKTTDGGNHWNKSQYFSSQTVRSICIQNGQNVWLVGDAGSVFRIK